MLTHTPLMLDGLPVIFIIRDYVKVRLSNTCFRGETKNLAGNFSAWENSYDMFFTDTWIMHELLEDIKEAHALQSVHNSVSINAGFPVGWSGTDERDNYSQADLELFYPNPKSKALRVDLRRHDLCAPLTDLFTIVYELSYRLDKVAVIIHSLYPGKDIGELVGDITEREKCVFFDWDHPGVPAP